MTMAPVPANTSANVPNASAASSRRIDGSYSPCEMTGTHIIRLIHSPFIGAAAMFHRTFALIAALVFGSAAIAEPLTFDLLVTNARVWTGDAKRPEAAVIGVFQ